MPAPRLTLSPGALPLAVLLVGQIVFSQLARDTRVELEAVPPAPPAAAVLAAIALGDSQAAYRAGGLALQNFGDTGGRWTRLADYDYARLVGWFERLVELDGEARYVPVLAAYYYAQTPVVADARAVIDFVAGYALARPARRWRLLGHAVYLARHHLGDLELALALARRLAALEVDGLPLWARQLPALVLAEMGETEAARREIEALARRYRDLPPEEARWHEYFRDRVLGVETPPEPAPGSAPAPTGR
jgi:tetratricopeptide (TPR) repeat protein